MTENKIYVGETVPLKITLKDEDGALYDPDSHSITYYNEAGTLKATDAAPTQVDPGIYLSTACVPDSTGIWRAVSDAVKSGGHSIETLKFEVFDPLTV